MVGHEQPHGDTEQLLPSQDDASPCPRQADNGESDDVNAATSYNQRRSVASDEGSCLDGDSMSSTAVLDNSDAYVTSNRFLLLCPLIIRVALSPDGRAQAIKILKYAGPLIAFLITIQAGRIFTVVISGHLLGQIELDAVALALSYTNVFGLAILLGLMTACETLMAQAYGSSNKKRTGVILQQGIVILSLASLPMSIIFFNAERFMLAVGQNPEVAKYVGEFATVNYFTLIPYMLYSIATRYLIAQGKIYPPVFFGICGNLFTAAGEVFCVKVLNMGVLGMSIGYLFGIFSYAILAWLYIWKRKVYKETWGGWSWECMYGWGLFSKLAVSGMLMVCIEWWSYEIVLVLSGIMGESFLAVSVVMYQIFVTLFMFPLGCGIGVSILIGNCLGAGKPATARNAAYTGLCMTGSLGVFFCILVYVLRDYLPQVFTSCDSVTVGFSELAVIACFLCLSDNLKAFYGGVLRGVGRQRHGAVINLISYYGLAFPIGVPLAFCTSLALKGIWMGFLIGMGIQVIIALTIIYRFDWDQESLKAQHRVGVENPILHQHTTKANLKKRKKLKQRAAAGSADNGRVALVSFHRLPPSGNSPTGEVSCEAVRIHDEHDITDIDENPMTLIPLDSDDTIANVATSAAAHSYDQQEADDAELLPDSSSPSSSAEDKYRGRPRGRILLARVIVISVAVFLLLLGIIIRVSVPFDRQEIPYVKVKCPGLDSNVSNSTTPSDSPYSNQSEPVDLSVLLSPSSPEYREPISYRYGLPETAYRVCTFVP